MYSAVRESFHQAMNINTIPRSSWSFAATLDYMSFSLGLNIASNTIVIQGIGPKKEYFTVQRKYFLTGARRWVSVPITKYPRRFVQSSEEACDVAEAHRRFCSTCFFPFIDYAASGNCSGTREHWGDYH